MWKWTDIHIDNLTSVLSLNIMKVKLKYKLLYKISWSSKAMLNSTLRLKERFWRDHIIWLKAKVDKGTPGETFQQKLKRYD